MFKEVKYINLHNDTDFPFMIDSWVDGSNKLQCLEVKPREKLVIHSSVGEWHMNSMFFNSETRKIWVDKGLDYMILVGKFRSTPCASGNYVWMEYDRTPFNCEYTEIENPENNIKGLMTITYVEK
jgi:hypothetical protein